MKEKDRENVFVGKVLSTLDKSTHDLDPETLSRLRIIRKEALETAKSSGPGSWLGLGSGFQVSCCRYCNGRPNPHGHFPLSGQSLRNRHSQWV